MFVTIANFKSIKCKTKITGKIPADDNIKNLKISVPLKYLNLL